MADWDQPGHESYDYPDARFLAPDPQSGRRPLSTRSPHSNDGRSSSHLRRPSLHRDYHSDNGMGERRFEYDNLDPDPSYTTAQHQPHHRQAPSPPPGNVWHSLSQSRSHSRHASTGTPHQMWGGESVEDQLLQLEDSDHNAKRLNWAKQEQDRLAASHAQLEHITIDVGPSAGKRGRSRNSIPKEGVPPRAPLVPGLHRRAIESDSEDSQASDIALKKPETYAYRQRPLPANFMTRERAHSATPKKYDNVSMFKKTSSSPPSGRHGKGQPSPRGKDPEFGLKRVPSPPPFIGRNRVEQMGRNTSPHAPNFLQGQYGHFTTISKQSRRRKSIGINKDSDRKASFSIPGAFPSGPGTVLPDDSWSVSSLFRQSKQSPPSLPPRPVLPPPSSSSGRLGDKGFQYSSLQEFEFRLLRILPTRMSTIKCEILHISLKSPPPYRAISYAWGDADDTRKILLEGTNVSIAVSLYGALEALREKKDAVLVWADFLCIDQQNFEEKGKQLQLMPVIYNRAEAVAIWLGPQADNSGLAVRLLEEVAANVEHPERVTALIETRAANKEFAAVVSLFERDYWRRLWVVQEVFNARDAWVLTSDSTIHWSVYRTASRVFWRHKNDLAYYFPTASCASRGQGASPNQFSFSQALVYQGPGSLPELSSLTGLGEESLLHVMRALRRKVSSDPRDKVFGILGILPHEIRNEFPVDLTLSLKEVYINVVDYLLSTTESIDVVCESMHFPLHTSTANLPSWCPDWSHMPETISLGSMYDFNASGKAKVKYRFVDERRNKLEISAVYVGTIKTHGVAVGTLCTLADYLIAFLHWRAVLAGSEVAEDEYAEDDFCRTLCVDQIPEGYDEHSWHVTCYHVFASLLEERLPYLKLDRELRLYADAAVNIKPEERREFLQQHFGSRMMGRCFFLTENGGMGMGSGFMTAGDVVVVPLGCSTPIILRSEGSKDEYRYVGDTYIDGYMQGEALKEQKDGTSRLSKFVLH